mgnify:CR=1 FL=1
MNTDHRGPNALGIVSLVCLVIGNMIGAGVYISSSYALDALQDARLVLVAWAIGGLHAICGAIAYAALARRAALTGGEYVFLSRFVHPAVGFVAGWISIIAGFTAPIAAAGLVFGEYLVGAQQATAESRIAATLLILASALFHSINLRAGAWVNNAIVALKFLGFAVFAASCYVFLRGIGLESDFHPALDRPFIASDYWSRFGEAGFTNVFIIQLFFIVLAYTGFNASIYIAGEIDSKWVPLSMVLACVLVTGTYLGLNALFLMCDTQSSIVQGRDYFVSGVAEHVGGPALQWVMRITIALSSATSVLAMLATGPRVVAQMARDGWLPRFLVGTDSTGKPSTPRVAIVVQAVASCLIVWNASLYQLTSYLGLTLTLCGAIATSTLWLAYSELNNRRKISWWEHLALAIYVAGALLLIATAWTIKQEQFWLCMATFASGVSIYLLAKLGKANPKRDSLERANLERDSGEGSVQ